MNNEDPEHEVLDESGETNADTEPDTDTDTDTDTETEPGTDTESVPTSGRRRVRRAPVAATQPAAESLEDAQEASAATSELLRQLQPPKSVPAAWQSPAGTSHPGITPSSSQIPAATAHGAAHVSRVITEWATAWKVNDDPYVSGLNEAIQKKANLVPWAALDPLDMLPVPTGQRGRRLRRIAGLLLALRNVSVFVPVALTWLAINKATEAFGPYIDSLKGLDEQQVSFLDFWQSGGTNGEFLDRFWRIQHVAFLDAIIIAFIIGATLVASALGARAAAMEIAEDTAVEADRRRVALQISIGLQGSRSASPESISEALAEALSDLLQAARAIGVAAERMESSTAGLHALSPEVGTLTREVASLSNHLANDVNASVGTLSSTVGALGVTLGGDMRRFVTDVLTGLEEINDRLGRTSASVEFGTKQLRDDLEAMHQRLVQLTGSRS